MKTKTIKIQKHIVRYVEVYQTGFKIELENFVNPDKVLQDIKTHSEINDIRDIQIHYKMDKDGVIYITLYAIDIDRIEFYID